MRTMDRTRYAFSPGEIARFRQETTGCTNVIHFNNAGSGLMPDVVTRAVQDHIKLETETGGYEAAALRAAAIREFYVQAGKLLNCKASNIAFTSSATDSYTHARSRMGGEGRV